MLRLTVFYSLTILFLAPNGIAWQKASRGAAVFTATAYSDGGVTAKGNITKPGTAAADPAVIPLGSKVRVTGAGAYSGIYSVTDTGQKVGGHSIDLFIPNQAEAKAFGKKEVQVEILATGDNVKGAPETAAKVPTSQLAPAEKVHAAPAVK
jgi:3D (Asp-Asp-Asp) domain-containing protein